MVNMADLTPETKKDLIAEILAKKSGESDKDWADIREEFDLDISPDTLRKAAVGVKLAMDSLEPGEAVESDPVFDMARIDRIKQRDLVNIANEVYRAESRSQLLRETIEDAVGKVNAISPLPGMKVEVHGGKYPSRHLVLTLGDFHYGADIITRGLHGEILNKYDKDVFIRRLAQLRDEVIKIVWKEEINDLDIFLVGDLIDGMLRQSQLMKLQYGIVDSTIQVSEILAQFLHYFDACKLNVTVHGCTGNHSEVRPLNAKARDFESENMERIIFWYLKSRLSNDQYITVDDDCERMKIVRICGYTFLLLHGDVEKHITGIARDAINLYRTPVDFFICGHLHKETEYPAGMMDSGGSLIIRTPSLCGMDKYAQSKGYGAVPGALAILMEEGYGRRCVYPIRLS